MILQIIIIIIIFQIQTGLPICCGGFVDEKLIKLYLQNYNK